MGGICLGRHLELRMLLLLHSGDASRTLHCIFSFTHGGRSPPCCPDVVWPTEVGPSITATVMSIASEYTSYRASGRSSGHSNLRHNDNTLQEIHPLYSLPISFDRNTSQRGTHKPQEGIALASSEAVHHRHHP